MKCPKKCTPFWRSHLATVVTSRCRCTLWAGTAARSLMGPVKLISHILAAPLLPVCAAHALTFPTSCVLQTCLLQSTKNTCHNTVSLLRVTSPW